jgi:hypothetical protein
VGGLYYGEREREKKVGGVVRDTTVWKVPRQCPLVLLVQVLFNFDLKDAGAAVVGEM